MPSILVVEPCDPRRIADPQAARGVHLQIDGLRVLSLSNLRQILVPEVQRTGPAFDPEQCALGADPQPALTVPRNLPVLVRRHQGVAQTFRDSPFRRKPCQAELADRREKPAALDWEQRGIAVIFMRQRRPCVGRAIPPVKVLVGPE